MYHDVGMFTFIQQIISGWLGEWKDETEYKYMKGKNYTVKWFSNIYLRNSVKVKFPLEKIQAWFAVL